jgi:hypothetical protein
LVPFGSKAAKIVLSQPLVVAFDVLLMMMMMMMMMMMAKNGRTRSSCDCDN